MQFTYRDEGACLRGAKGSSWTGRATRSGMETELGRSKRAQVSLPHGQAWRELVLPWRVCSVIAQLPSEVQDHCD